MFESGIASVNVVHVAFAQVGYWALVVIALILDRSRGMGSIKQLKIVSPWLLITTLIIIGSLKDKDEPSIMIANLSYNSVHIIYILISIILIMSVIRKTGHILRSPTSPIFFMTIPIIIFLNTPKWIVVVLSVIILIFFYKNSKNNLYQESSQPIGFRIVTILCIILTTLIGVISGYNTIDRNYGSISGLPNIDVSILYFHEYTLIYDSPGSNRVVSTLTRGDSAISADSTIGEWNMIQSFAGLKGFVRDKYLFDTPPAARWVLVTVQTRPGRVRVRRGPGTDTETVRRLGSGTRVWVEDDNMRWVEVFEREGDLEPMGFIRRDLLSEP